MGLFDETAKAIPGQDVGDTSTSGLGSLAAKAIQKAVDDGVINPNVTTTNTPLSDLRTIIVRDPSMVDPSFDISGVRTTTPTRSELLAAVPEFSGFEYDPTQRSYIEDLYALYGGAVPTVDVAQDTAQIPGAIDTLVDVGGGGGMDQVTGGSVLDTPTGGLTESGTFAGQPTFTTTPGTTVDNVTGDITNPDGSYGGNIVDEFVTPPSGITGDPIDVGIPDNESGFVDPLGTIGGAPVISPVLTNQGPVTIEGSLIPGDIPGVNPVDEVALTGGAIAPTLEAQDVDASGNLLQSGINKIKSIIPEFDPLITVGKLALNAFIGKPISLAIDAIGALASNLPPGISETTNKAREVGLLQGDSTVTQDVYGINTQSMFGDYNQYNLDRVKELQEKIDDGTIQQYKDDGTLTYLGTELEKRKDYIESTGAAGDITPDATPLDIATGNLTGDATIAETIAQNQNIVDEVALTGGDDFDVTNEAAVNVGTPSFEGFDSGGFDPAPAPAPTTPSAPPSQGFGGGGGRDRDRGNGGGGGGNQGGSSGGGESGYGGFCFDPNTPIQMADGSEKKIKEVQLGDQTKGGEVTGVFQFKAADEIHDYKGVTVAGSHYVKEDGRFIMVQDSPISVKINKIPVVYSLDTTGRRIFIKDIEFADYNGDGIAKGFLANAGVNISGFNEEVLRQVENRLI